MFKINLVPEIQKNKNTMAKINSYATLFGSILIIGTVAIIVIMIIINTAQKAVITRIDSNIEKVKNESKEYEELEKVVISLEEGLKSVKKTLSGENNWTLLLPHLEAAIPNDARYEKLQINGDGTITAEVTGTTINALSRYIQSHKSYEVISFKGAGKPGETVIISQDASVINNEDSTDAETSNSGKELATLKVGPNGNWTKAIKINPGESLRFNIKIADKSIKINYEKADGEKVSESGVTAESGNLFTEMESTSYSKKGQEVRFDATFKFESRFLW